MKSLLCSRTLAIAFLACAVLVAGPVLGAAGSAVTSLSGATSAGHRAGLEVASVAPRAKGILDAGAPFMRPPNSDGPSRAPWAPSGATDATTCTLRDGTPLVSPEFYHPATQCLAFSPDGRLLASGGRDARIRIWEVGAGRCTQVLSGNGSRVTSLAFSPDGRLLASASGTDPIQFWEVQTWVCTRTLSGDSRDSTSLVFGPNGDLLASAGEWPQNRSLRLWAVATGECLHTCSGHLNGFASFAFSPDGRLLASAGLHDDEIRLWDTGTGKCSRTIPPGGPVRSIALSRNGRLLAYGAEYDGSIKLCDLQTDRCIRTLPGERGAVTSVAFTPDGQLLASAALDQGVIRLWEVDTGRLRRVLSGRSNRNTSLAFSPDGKLVASVEGPDELPQLWVVATGKPVVRRRGEMTPMAAAVAPDGGKLAVCEASGKLAVIDLRTGKVQWSLGGFWVDSDRALAFDAAGGTLAVLDLFGISLWDVATGSLRGKCAGLLDHPMEMAFSADGHKLRAVDALGRERVTDLTDAGRSEAFAYVRVSVTYAPEDVSRRDLLISVYDEIGRAARARGYRLLSPAAAQGQAGVRIVGRVSAENAGVFGFGGSIGHQPGLRVHADVQWGMEAAHAEGETPRTFRALDLRKGAVAAAKEKFLESLSTTLARMPPVAIIRP